MDQQRSTKLGRANFWVVIPINNIEIRKNLQQTYDYLTQKNKTVKSELNKALIDLSSNALHITLFGVHSNAQRFEQLKEAIKQFEKRQTEPFDVEVKGLGVWDTAHHNIIMFADLTTESAERVKLLAKEMRDFVLHHITSQEVDTEPQVRSTVAFNSHAKDIEDKGEDLPGMWLDDPQVSLKRFLIISA